MSEPSAKTIVSGVSGVSGQPGNPSSRFTTPAIRADEQVVHIHPEPAAQIGANAGAGWRRRLNVFPGRTLTDRGLAAEHAHRSGHLATRGRLLSPGVIAGLEADLSPDRARVHLGPGIAMSCTGEDVSVPRPLAAAVDQLALYMPADGTLLPPDAPLGDRPVLLGGTLAEVGLPGVDLPRAFILLVQPVVAELSELDPRDPCEVDPDAAAFADWQLVDGARLALFPWPWDDVLPAPELSETWRSLLAHRVFDEEQALPAGQRLPWEPLGVALGLMAFADGQVGQAAFLDRHAVRRAGGRIGAGRPLVAGAGDPALWQARLQQFLEHLGAYALGDLVGETPLRPFERVPPVGLLPREALDLASRSTTFFPGHFDIDTAPVPMSQVEAVLEDMAGLAPIAMSTDALVPASVRILLPVPDERFEPALLDHEEIDPEIEAGVAEATLRRNELLARRRDVRARYTALVDGLDGSAVTFPSPDPEEIEPIDEGSLPPVSGEPEDDFGTVIGGDGNVLVQVVEDLLAILPDGADEAIAADGVEGVIKILASSIRQVEDRINLGFVRVQSDTYRLRQFVLDRGDATRLATSPVLATIAQQDSAATYRQELGRFAETLRASLGRETFTATATGQTTGETGETSAATTMATKATSDATITASAVAPGTGIEAAVPGAPVGGRAILDPSRMFSLSTTGFLSERELIKTQPMVLIPDLRHVSLAERLAEPASKTAWTYAVATKYELVVWLHDLHQQQVLPVESVEIPAKGFGDGRDTVKVGELDDELLRVFAQGSFNQPPVPATGGVPDEGAYVTAGVGALEETTMVLRQLEVLVDSFRALVAQAEAARQEIKTWLAAAQGRLGELAVLLAEARHDLSVARILLAEDQQRVDAINQRRQQTLAEAVPYLLFHRRREVAALAEAPAWPLAPAQVPDPLPGCANERVPAPPELARMVDLLRQAPARWFPAALGLLDRLDALEAMEETIRAAGSRAQSTVSAVSAVSAVSVEAGIGAGLFQMQITSVIQAQLAVVTDFRRQVVLRQPAALGQPAAPGQPAAGTAFRPWGQARAEAEEVVSLGDLLDAGHGRSSVAREAAALIERIYRVSACLYQRFGEVLPARRLQWAERLSQYDAAVDLRHLAALPGWGDAGIDHVDRRQMQMLVDWLYQQVDARHGGALALVHDLVRVCLLLASHAPVRRILTGRVKQATTAAVGGLIRIVADIARLRIGAHVFLETVDQRPVRAVVADLGNGEAAARIVDAPGPTVQLAADAVARFVEPEGQLLGPVARTGSPPRGTTQPTLRTGATSTTTGTRSGIR